MKLSKWKSAVIKKSLTPSDVNEVAIIATCSADYIRKVLNGSRSYQSEKGERIVHLLISKARVNKKFRQKAS